MIATCNTCSKNNIIIVVVMALNTDIQMMKVMRKLNTEHT